MRIITNALFLALMGSAVAVQASGFALIEQSASGQGLSYAGAAANSEDVSVMWFNPAGLASIKGNQAILGAHVISPRAKFEDEGSTYSGSANSGSGGDDGGTVGLVPNVYWKTQVGQDHFGIGLNVPFGQHLSYDENWAGRYQATETDLKTFNINPAWARSINDQWQIGFGFNAQYVNVNLEQKMNQSLIGKPDGNAKVTGDNWGFGYNAGILFKPTQEVTLGLSYRSEVVHNVHGKADYDNVDNTIGIPSLGGKKLSEIYFDANAFARVTLPASASFAVDYQATNKLQVLASTTWTGWGAYDQLVVEFDNYSPDSESRQNFKDSWRYALGLAYQATDSLKLRTGVALDNTPVPDKYSRSPRTPDTNRKWISFGLGYAFSPTMQMDLAYTHIAADKADVHYTNDDKNTLIGQYHSEVNIFSAQMVWKY